MRVFRGFLFLGIGLLLAVFGLATIGIIAALGSAMLTAPGEVVHMRAGSAHFDVEFTTVDDEVVRYSQDGLVHQQLGDVVQVRYHPDSPHQSASLDTVFAHYTFPMFLCPLGMVFVVAGTAELLSHRRTQQLNAELDGS